MKYFAGLDVSLETICVCIVDDRGEVVREAVVPSDPEPVAAFLRGCGLAFGRIGLEAGPLAPWLYWGLVSAGLPVFCIETRRMKAFAAASPVKTDRKDARLIAQAMRVGLYREVHVKDRWSQEARLLLRARRTLLDEANRLALTVRGLLKAFGVKLGKVGSKGLEARVLELAGDDLAAKVAPLLKARAEVLRQHLVLDRQVRGLARQDEVCRRLMTIPGVGELTALSYRTGIDHPHRFAKSSNVAAHLGLTPRKYASGEVDRTGRISKCGDKALRALLYEAAMVMLTRTKKWCALKSWGVAIAKRRGLKVACVAVARRLAIIMHRMWIDGTTFAWKHEETPATG